MGHSISAIDQRGGVQIRINGIIADKAEMLSLDPKSIRKIDFIDNPGVRYGDGIAYVIDITTRRADNGYTLGTSLTQALTTRDGDYTVYGKWNTGKSELSLNYSFGYRDFKGIRTEETAYYHLNDGSIYTIQRNDLASRNRSLARTALHLHCLARYSADSLSAYVCAPHLYRHARSGRSCRPNPLGTLLQLPLPMCRIHFLPVRIRHG